MLTKLVARKTIVAQIVSAVNPEFVLPETIDKYFLRCGVFLDGSEEQIQVSFLSLCFNPKTLQLIDPEKIRNFQGPILFINGLKSAHEGQENYLKLAQEQFSVSLCNFLAWKINYFSRRRPSISSRHKIQCRFYNTTQAICS